MLCFGGLLAAATVFITPGTGLDHLHYVTFDATVMVVDTGALVTVSSNVIRAGPTR